MNNKYLASCLLVFLSLVIGLVSYPALPQMVASHWGLSGQVNGYQGKTVAILLMPILMAGLVALFFVLPKVDPLGKNIQQFQKQYDSFVLFLIGFLSYLHVLTLVWNLGWKFDLIRFLIPAYSLFIFGLGYVLAGARPNWFFGIRTPWTMSNGRVWYHTHELGGKLYKLAGVLALGGFFWPNLALFFMIVPIIAVSLYLVIFSYFDWRREKNS